MPKLTIDWNWQYLPSNADVVSPLANQVVDGKEVLLFYNHTQKQMVFEYEGSYGILVLEEPRDADPATQTEGA